MKLSRMAATAASVFCILLWVGCGDTFRPVATPIGAPGGDPQSEQLALVLNQGGATPGTSPATCGDGTTPPCLGAITQINVSGDTNSGNFEIGKTPVHATLLSGIASQVFTANRDENTLSVYFPIFGGSTPTTITLPAGTLPVYVQAVNAAATATVPLISAVYVAGYGNDTVPVVNQVTSSVTTTLDIASVGGHHPVGMAASTNAQKVYVVNRDSNNVVVISTIDNTILTTIAVGSTPEAAIANPNGTRIYVLNSGSNTISVIDPANDQVLPAETLSLPAGGTNATCAAGMGNCMRMTFDTKLQRLYVANPASNSVSIFDTSVTPATPLAVVSDPSLTNPVAVAPLANGSRFYVVSGNSTTGCSGEAESGRITAFTVGSNAAKCITVGNSPAWIDSSSDSAKIYVPHRLGTSTNSVEPGTSIVTTSNNSVIVDIPAPFTARNCSSPSATCVRMQPSFMLTSK